jgi:hypothetical protein
VLGSDRDRVFPHRDRPPEAGTILVFCCHEFLFVMPIPVFPRKNVDRAGRRRLGMSDLARCTYNNRGAIDGDAASKLVTVTRVRSDEFDGLGGLRDRMAAASG